MEFIDAHAHIYDRLTPFGPKGEGRAIGNGLVEWATGEKERFLNPEHGEFGFSYEMLLSLMDEANISKSVLMQCSNYGFQNSYTHEAVSKYSDRFIGAGTFDPYAKYSDDIFSNLIDKFGYKILKFELSELYGLTGYHSDLSIDSNIFAPYLKMCEDLDITICIDTGFIDTKSCNINALLNVIKKYKNLKLVLAHTFFPSEDGKNDYRLDLIKKVKGENIFFDIAGVFPLNAPKGRFTFIKRVIDLVGSDHIMWGTDSPGAFIHATYKKLIDNILNNLDVKHEDLINLFGKTARYVYKID